MTTLTASMVGDTIPLLLFRPDWSKPVVEQLEWKTQILRAYDGSEQRRATRLHPRRALSYSVTLDNRDAAAFENTVYGGFASLLAVPLWTDKVRLTAAANPTDASLTVSATADVRLSEGLALLIYKSRTEYEVVEPNVIGATSISLLDTVTGTWPAGTAVYPVVVVKLPGDTPIEWITSSVLVSSLNLQTDPVSCPVTAAEGAAASTYNGYEVVLTQPNWIRAVSAALQAAYGTVDNGSGAIAYFGTETFPRQARRYSWTLTSRAEISDFLEFLNRRRGMAKPFYAPTWNRDFRVVAASGSPTQTYLDVQENGFEEFVGVDTTRDRLLVRMANGDTYYRRITNVADQGGGVTRLTLDSTLGITFSPSDFKDIHLMQLCRLATDNVSIEWMTDTVATVETTLITVSA